MTYRKMDEADGAGILEQMRSYEEIRERLLIRPLCYHDCRLDLKEYVYEKCGDIVLVLYLTVYEGDQGLGTIRVPRPVAEGWKLPRKCVWEEALRNTCEQAPPRLYVNPIDCVGGSLEKGDFMSENSGIQRIDPEETPLLTTTKRVNGAIAMFYPGVKERLALLTGGSFYVAFTSIHEACVHPAGSVPPIRILRSLKHLNRTCGVENRLSQKVFFYNQENGSFRAVEF